MPQKGKLHFKFKTYKSDAAPFFFFIDIFPPKPDGFDKPRSSYLANRICENPIMPLPMRVDRVFNGENSIILRPNDPIVFPINESISAIVNPIPFLQLGFEKLLFYTEIRSFEKFSLSLKKIGVQRWWEATRYLYGNLAQIEEDFSAFLNAYLYTIVKAKINEEDIIGAAVDYCDIVNKICKERLLRNTILVRINNNQENVKLFKEKTTKYRNRLKTVRKTEYHPELVDIEVFNLSENGFSHEGIFKDTIGKNFKSNVLKYIPLLFYDDLQECILQNLKLIETNELEVQSPSYLLDKNVILIQKSEDLSEKELNKYSWLSNLSEINIGTTYNFLTESINLFYKRKETGKN
ncbi:MAG: hypothetical protein HWN80_18175 [Candidatus Lokiarchaeota archaeon]|nr:hypothetical protein [Candidatus Lokiarchaeota archaeon]